MHELTICKSNLSLVLPIGRYTDFFYIHFIAYVYSVSQDNETKPNEFKFNTTN